MNTKFEEFLNKWNDLLISSNSYTQLDRLNFERCLRLYHEIIEKNGNIIGLDDADFEKLFCKGGPVTSFEAICTSVSSTRMNEVVMSIKSSLSVYAQSYNNVMLCVLYGADKPFMIEEMEKLRQIVSLFSNNTEILWGLKETAGSNIRIALMLNSSIQILA